jgi:hypothetical protein
MSANEDRDLKDAFEALGRSVRSTEPSFDQMTSHETLNAARWRQQRHRAVLLVIGVAVPAFLALRAHSDDALDYKRFTALTGLDLSDVTWEAPSDFLLDVPGRDLLRRVPLIEVQAPAFTLDSVRPPVSNDTQWRSRS